MNISEQRMCELQADLFELSLRRFKCSSSFFIARFMNSKSAKDLDNVDDPYNYYSPNSILDALESAYPSLKSESENKYNAQVMRWIGYIYRSWVILKHRSSYDIYKLMKAEKMLALYDTFHTLGIDYCIERLEEIVNAEIGQHRSDYEIFKEIMLQPKY